MARQRIKHGSQSLTIIIMMLGILFFINVLSTRFFVRADLTENKEYTITDSTKSILENLDDIVNIRFYFSKDLPSYIANLESQVRDMLDEYRAYSGGNLSVEFVDPSSDEALKEKLQRLGIPELELTVLEKDKRSTRKAYLGISIQFGDKSEVIPVIRSMENLEYDLTSALFKVTDTKERIVGWIGANEVQNEQPDGYKQMIEVFNESYLVRPLEPDKLGKIAGNMDLVLVDGSKPLPDRALYAIDQFIMNNGKVIFLTDTVNIDRQTMSATAITSRLNDLLEHYGVQVGNKLVLDRRNAYAAFNSGFVRFSVPYPFWPKITSDGFNPEVPAVSQLESLALPWVSPLHVREDESSELKYTSLVRSSKASWLEEEPYDLNPRQRFDVTTNDLTTSQLAVQVDGRFRSFFEGKEIPPDPQAGGRDGEPPVPDEVKVDSEDTSIIVLANSRFVNNQFLQMFPGNLIFMQNIADSFSIGDQLIGIRSRKATERMLDYGFSEDELADKERDLDTEIEQKKTFHRVLGTVGVPIVLIVFGFTRLSTRRKRKDLDQDGRMAA